MTPLGRKVVYPINQEQEYEALLLAFLNIDLFKKVFDFYKGNALPEERFVCNTLRENFEVDPSYHEDFLKVYQSCIDYLNKRKVFNSTNNALPAHITTREVAPKGESAQTCGTNLFVIMPFSEKTGNYPDGYFDEVYSSLIVPSAAAAGFNAKTANINGSDIIHRTIVSSIHDAEIILADLTEHNPNVLFELGLAIAFKKKVAIIRAKGTPAIFDVDNSMRVLDYNPNLWKSTLEMDIEKLSQHITATMSSDESMYLDIFLDKPVE